MNLNFVPSGKKYHKCWKGEPPVQDVLSYSTAQGCGMEAWIEIWMNWDELGFEWISSWLTIQNWSTLVIPARRELFDQEESIVWKKLHIYVCFVFASWSLHYVKPLIAFFFQDNILITFCTFRNRNYFTHVRSVFHTLNNSLETLNKCFQTVQDCLFRNHV